MGSHISQEELEELSSRMTKEGLLIGLLVNSVVFVCLYNLI
jgi:hypothetical protein